MALTIPHRIVVAPSGFKESLSTQEVAESIAAGVRRVLPGTDVRTFPVVDGGEGTAACLAEVTGGRIVPVEVTGPVGEPVRSHYALLGGAGEGIALVEMAAAAGLRLVPRDARDPARTTTRGVGELLLAALESGARRIVIGCGDSGTCDGGAGFVEALGGRLLDAHGRELPGVGTSLSQVASLDLTGLDPRLADVEIDVACNIHNVLCGPRGVARVFGPQKGATPEQVEELSAGLERWAGVLAQACQVPACLDLEHGPGTGASGGLGAAVATVAGGRLRSRFDVLLDSGLMGGDLDEAIATADLVITAEGAVDYQTPRGKVPAEVARRAKRVGVPVIAMAGSIGERADEVHDIGIDAVAGIIPIPMDLAQAVEEASRLVADAAERMMRFVVLGAVIAHRTEQATLETATR